MITTIIRVDGEVRLWAVRSSEVEEVTAEAVVSAEAASEVETSEAEEPEAVSDYLFILSFYQSTHIGILFLMKYD